MLHCWHINALDLEKGLKKNFGAWQQQEEGEEGENKINAMRD